MKNENSTHKSKDKEKLKSPEQKPIDLNIRETNESPESITSIKGDRGVWVNVDESPLNPTHSGLMAKHYMDEFNKEEARLLALKTPKTELPSAKRAGTEPSLNKYLKLYLQYANK